MNDEELPINDELASAYLDDELDATERAAASANPEVMATVESFARVRSALSEIEPVAGSRQERRTGRRARRVRHPPNCRCRQCSGGNRDVVAVPSTCLPGVDRRCGGGGNPRDRRCRDQRWAWQ